MKENVGVVNPAGDVKKEEGFMRRTLKKTVAVGLAAATAFSLCACGGSGDGSKSGEQGFT